MKRHLIHLACLTFSLVSGRSEALPASVPVPYFCRESLSVLTSSERSAVQQAIPEGTHLITVANRLPVTLEFQSETFIEGKAGGGLVSAMRSTGEKFTWLGWLGSEIAADHQATAKARLKHMDEKLDLKPVFYSKAEKEAFYDEFSNRVLWPIFHDLRHLVPKKQKGWAEYRSINSRFAEEIVEAIQEQAIKSDDEILVMVHDYQLGLVPQMIRRKLQGSALEKRVKIGFFLHIPFPPPEVFALLPESIRREILAGLEGADLIGVHTPEYAKNLQATFRKEGFLVRAAKVAVHPIGINPEDFRSVLNREDTQNIILQLREDYRGYKLVLGVERLDPIKGIEEKLEGFRQYLREHPEELGKVVLLQVVQPSRLDIPEYLALRDRVVMLGQEINREFARPGRWPPVILNHKGFNTQELVAHMSIASTTIISSLKDGMNLVAFETTAMQKDRAEPANLILSKNTGAAEWLQGALLVNPNDTSEMAKALHRALQMSASERRERIQRDLHFVETNTSQQWMSKFLHSLHSH